MQILHDAPAQLVMPERLLLYSLVSGLRPTAAVEIGTAEGGAAMIICAAMDAVDRGKLVCVDPAPKVTPNDRTKMSHRVSFLESASPEAIAEAHRLLGAFFDFVFVDGNHTYDGVLCDINALVPFLHEDSYLLFHDVHYFEVQDAINEALQRHPFVDCGLLSLDATRTEDVHLGKPVVWGGLRLLRFSSAAREGDERNPQRVTQSLEVERLIGRLRERVSRVPGRYGQMTRSGLKFMYRSLLWIGNRLV
jgi:hypothetical protein